MRSVNPSLRARGLAGLLVFLVACGGERPEQAGTPPEVVPGAQDIAPVELADCKRPPSSFQEALGCETRLQALDHEVERLRQLAVASPQVDSARRDLLQRSEAEWRASLEDCSQGVDVARCATELLVRRIHELRQGYAAARATAMASISSGPKVLSCEGLGALVGVTLVRRSDSEVARLSPSRRSLQYLHARERVPHSAAIEVRPKTVGPAVSNPPAVFVSTR